MIREFEFFIPAIENDILRMQVNNYFYSVLKCDESKAPKQKEKADAVDLTLQEFPVVADYFIRYKENNGEGAESIANKEVDEVHAFLIEQVK